MTEREALKLALEALKELRMLGMNAQWHDSWLAKPNEAIIAIREVLAQPEQEPVWIQPNHLQKARQAPFLCRVEPKQRDDFVPLYTTPPQRNPLTDVEIWNTYKNLWMFHPADEPRLAGDVLKFARAIEAAHGIKE